MKINNKYNGFTLVESLVAIGVMAYIFCGVMYIFSITTKNLARDTIIEDTQHYFSRILDQISNDIKFAKNVEHAINGSINELRITDLNGIPIIYRQDDFGGYGISRNNGPVIITNTHNYIFNHSKYDIVVEEIIWNPEVNITNGELMDDLRTCGCIVEIKFVVKITEKDIYDHPFKRLVFHDWVFANYIYAVS